MAKTDDERAAHLREKIAKLRKLAEGEGPEAKLAKEKADALDRELRALDAKAEQAPERRRKPPVARQRPAPARRTEPALVCRFDEEPIVEGEALQSITHRYFQLAEHAARWSGVLLHIDRKWLAPYALFYGPPAQIAKARSRYSRLRRTFDRKVEAWAERQDYEPTESERDGYARGFLQGLDEHEREKETAEQRRERERLLRRCDAAYRASV